MHAAQPHREPQRHPAIRTRPASALTAVLTGALALTTVVAGVVTTAGPARAAHAVLTPTVPAPVQRQQFLDAVNAERTRQHLPPVQYNPAAERIAQAAVDRSAQTPLGDFLPTSAADMAAAGCATATMGGAVGATGDTPHFPDATGAAALEHTSAFGGLSRALLDPAVRHVGLGVTVVQFSYPGSPTTPRYRIQWNAVAGDCTPVTTPNPDGSTSYDGVPVKGAILQRYLTLGADRGFLRAPTGPEFGPLRGHGFGQHFRGGSLYWTPATGAHPVGGQIRDEYARMGWENSWLGYPVSAENPIRGGVFQRFQGGLVYWSPATGAHAVRGAILDLYARYGWETGPLGFPTRTETPLRDGGAYSAFQHGNVYWTPWLGAHSVRGLLRDSYLRSGAENGTFGYPVSEERPVPFRADLGVKGAWGQDFERGYMEAHTKI